MTPHTGSTASTPDRVWPLYAAVFNHALGLGMMMVALPFFSKQLGASATLIGIIGAAMQISYAGGCTLLRSKLDRISPRTLTTLAMGSEALLVLMIAMVGSLPVLLALVAVQGLCMSMFWPAIMGWLSTGVGGQDLNGRLRRFNLSWCGAMIAGPFVGGVLYELAPAIPFYGAAIAMLLAMGLIRMIRLPLPQHMPTTVDDGRAEDEGDANTCTRRVAWVGLFFGWMVMGLLRYQLPSLAVAIGMREAVYGAIGTALSASMAVAFVLLGRSDRLHSRTTVQAIGQCVVAAGILALCWVQGAVGMAMAVTVSGVFLGMIYARSIYYSAAGAGSRAASRLAVHEVALSAGFVTGAIGSGLLTQYVHLRSAYPVCAGLVLLGLGMQILLLSRGRRSQTVRNKSDGDG